MSIVIVYISECVTPSYGACDTFLQNVQHLSAEHATPSCRNSCAHVFASLRECSYCGAPVPAVRPYVEFLHCNTRLSVERPSYGPLLWKACSCGVFSVEHLCWPTIMQTHGIRLTIVFSHGIFPL